MNQPIIKDAIDTDLGFSAFISKDLTELIKHLKEFDTIIYPQLEARGCGLVSDDNKRMFFLHRFIYDAVYLIQTYIYNNKNKFFNPKENMKDVAEWFMSFFDVLSLGKEHLYANYSKLGVNIFTAKILLRAYYSFIKNSIANEKNYTKTEWITIITLELKNAFNLFMSIDCLEVFFIPIKINAISNNLQKPLPYVSYYDEKKDK